MTAVATIIRCPKCQATLTSAQCPSCDCVEPSCLRGQYADGRCKRHADEWRYARMRELEQVCVKGVRVRYLVNREYLTGVAQSRVRIVEKDIPSRDRWPSVSVRLDGHTATYELPAIEVEVA